MRLISSYKGLIGSEGEKWEKGCKLFGCQVCLSFGQSLSYNTAIARIQNTQTRVCLSESSATSCSYLRATVIPALCTAVNEIVTFFPANCGQSLLTRHQKPVSFLWRRLQTMSGSVRDWQHYKEENILKFLKSLHWCKAPLCKDRLHVQVSRRTLSFSGAVPALGKHPFVGAWVCCSQIEALLVHCHDRAENHERHHPNDWADPERVWFSLTESEKKHLSQSSAAVEPHYC